MVQDHVAAATSSFAPSSSAKCAEGFVASNSRKPWQGLSISFAHQQLFEASRSVTLEGGVKTHRPQTSSVRSRPGLPSETAVSRFALRVAPATGGGARAEIRRCRPAPRFGGSSRGLPPLRPQNSAFRRAAFSRYAIPAPADLMRSCAQGKLRAGHGLRVHGPVAK